MAALDSLPDPVSLLKGMKAMASRGPDGSGWRSSANGKILLGHRRLAVIDREGGAQPIFNEDGSVMAVVNGEFYGFQSIRRNLEQRGHRFRTATDSEILLHLYEEDGDSAVEQLRGEFAFVIWDENRQRLLAGRDRFGIKPLLYGWHGDVLHVGSSAKGLFAAGFPRAWDQQSLYQAMCLQYPLPGRTLFQGIAVLPPGHLLSLDAGILRITRFWDMNYPLQSEPEATGSVESFRDRLRGAVRLRLHADVPVAFQLSGGIDSSSVAALAAQDLGVPAPCFTVGFEGGDYDERRLAAEVATFIGGRHHVIHVGSRDLADGFSEAVYAGEGLCINAHLVAKHKLSHAIREAGYKVVLTGEGADEVLLGYAHLRQDQAGDGASLAQTNAASMGIMLPSGDQLSSESWRARLGPVPTWLQAKASLGFRVRSLLAADWLESQKGQDPFGALAEAVDLHQIRDRPRPIQSIYLWSKLALEGYILRTLGDGMEMANGIEGRLPFLDGEVFEWARQAPMASKINGTTEKWVLREAMKGLLPESVRTREKHPFLAPPQFTLGSPFSGLLADLLDRPGVGMPFFDKVAVRNLLNSSSTPSSLKDPALFLVASSLLLNESLGLSEGA